MTDFALPTLSDTYTNFLAYLKNRDVSIAGMLDPVYFGSDTNIPTNASRLNTTTVGGAVFQRYNGATWVESATGYAIAITGNAATSTKWAATKTIQLTGPITGTSGGLDGSANVTLATTLATVTAILGGTGQTVYAVGDILAANTTTNLQKIPDVAVGSVLTSGGIGVLPAWGKVNLSGASIAVQGTLAPTLGGTGLATMAAGTLLYASALNTIAALAAAAAGNVLISGTNPSWAKVDMTTHISGIAPIANGGTNMTTYTTGDIVHATGTNVLGKLVAAAVNNVLLSSGAGVISAWGKVGLQTHISGILLGANGGTGNGFMAFSGPATSLKTFTLPNASATLVYEGGPIGTPTTGTVEGGTYA
jgi:hypothetical protein